MESMLLPVVDEDSGPFWDAARRGELVMQGCASCGRLRFPPRPMCPHCQSLEVTWSPMSGRGTIWSFVVPHPPQLPGYSDVAPYNVVVVTLDEDPTLRLVGNLVTAADGPINELLDVPIGAPVRVVFAKVSDDISLPRWVPA
jgi:uncharacterized OB-fold protein